MLFNIFKRRVHLVCFDLDNTLCDFGAAESETEAYVAGLIVKDIHKLMRKKKHHGITAFNVLRLFNDVKNSHVHHDTAPGGFSRALWFRELFESIDASYNISVSLNGLIMKNIYYEKKYWDYLVSRIKLFPNTINTLEWLRSNGLKIAMITDSDGERSLKIYRIKKSGLDKYFDYIITTDDTGVNKPDVLNWKRLMELSGLKSRECMMVGDHPEVDLHTAKKLGFITVWTEEELNTDLHWKYVDYEIKDIKEVIGIVEKING